MSTKRIEWVCPDGRCGAHVITHQHGSKPDEHPVKVEHFCRGRAGNPQTPMAEWPHADGGG